MKVIKTSGAWRVDGNWEKVKNFVNFIKIIKSEGFVMDWKLLKAMGRWKVM